MTDDGAGRYGAASNAGSEFSLVRLDLGQTTTKTTAPV
jgi:hypothetical protein